MYSRQGQFAEQATGRPRRLVKAIGRDGSGVTRAVKVNDALRILHPTKRSYEMRHLSDDTKALTPER